MKRILILLSILGLSYFGKSQGIQTLGTSTSTVNAKGGFLVDSLFVLPLRDTVFPPSYNASLRKLGAMVVKGTNIYYYNNSSWIAFSTSTIDTTSLSNRINERVKYSDSNTVYVPKYGVDTARTTINSNINARVKYTDTATMLAPYLRSIDTASLSSRINLKLNISDTANMLTPYLRKVDTASLSNRINLKLSIADSSTAYVTPTRLADTATVLRGLIPTVPTIYYQTMKRNGTPYTQQPTLDFSTQFSLNDNIGNSATDVSVSALAQSVVTGLTDSLNSMVRYVDTSGMLTNYATKNGSNASGTWGINITGNSATTTTNANLTGVITSVGNATSIASQTGTGTKFVVDNTPTLITPILGVASATSLNTGTTLNGTIFAKSANLVSLSSTNHALTAGNESTGLNMAFGLYSTSLGIQARNNGVASNIFYNPLGGSVGVGDGSLTGQRIFLVTNTGAGTGDWSSVEVRNGSASSDALRMYTLGTGFTTSVTNVQDGGAVTTGTGLSGGLSVGTQANADLRLYTNNTLRWTMAGSTGNITATGQFVSSGGGIGYTTGAGGTVTQITSKSTGVTLNKLCGQITMHNASLSANAEAVFTLTNSFIEANDAVFVCLKSSVSAGRYLVGVATVSAGSCQIVISNVGSVASESPIITFVVIKAVNN